MELKNQPINKRVHKTLCINFRACAAFFPKVMYISLLDRNDVFQLLYCVVVILLVSRPLWACKICYQTSFWGSNFHRESKTKLFFTLVFAWHENVVFHFPTEALPWFPNKLTFHSFWACVIRRDRSWISIVSGQMIDSTNGRTADNNVLVARENE